MPKRVREHCVGLKHVKQFTFECGSCGHNNTHTLPEPAFILFNETYQCRNSRQWTRLKIFEPDHRKCDWCNLQAELEDRQFEDWCLCLCPECAGYFDETMEAFNTFKSFVIAQLPKLIQEKRLTGKKVDLKRLLPGGHKGSEVVNSNRRRQFQCQ